MRPPTRGKPRIEPARHIDRIWALFAVVGLKPMQAQIGGYARAGSTGGGSGASRARRIAGGVTAGSGVASWRAVGLWTVRGRHRFDLPWCG
jgi:hypothetical protein